MTYCPKTLDSDLIDESETFSRHLIRLCSHDSDLDCRLLIRFDLMIHLLYENFKELPPPRVCLSS
jgi:hypothetical protein